MLLQAREVRARRARRRVAAVQERIDRERHRRFGDHVDQRFDVVERAVHLAVRHEAEQVQRTAGFAHVVDARAQRRVRSEEHTSELQSRQYLVCRLLLEKKKMKYTVFTCEYPPTIYDDTD